ncbi:MAG: hypothetical protein HUJ72_01815 [Blautia sp.]|nr:hypothetical protein [Blautia sp.]
MNGKKWKAGYLIVMMAICLLPLVGKLWTEDVSKENRELKEWPTIRMEDGSVNKEYLSEMGAYFEDHFAFRQQMATANAKIKFTVFEMSPVDGVIVGRNGWLYYKDSLEDYQGTSLLSERGIYNLARAFRLMQDYAWEKGAKFCLAIAPNKNTLYGSNMPYYYQYIVNEQHNLFLLTEELEKQGVTYADLYQILQAEDAVLYHAKDSHWDNRGARLAADGILKKLDVIMREYGNCEVRTDKIGDLETMLFPGNERAEEEYYYEAPFTYRYVKEIESTFDPEIYTEQEDGNGNLLMFRDSFGNALLPYIAEEFETAKFTRALPYRLDEIAFSGADTVILERAERFLPDMAREAPVFPAPIVEQWQQGGEQMELSQETADQGVNLQKKMAQLTETQSLVNCSMEEDGFYLRFFGEIAPEYADKGLMDPDSGIYLNLNSEVLFEATPVIGEMESDYGFAAYIEKERLEDSAFSIGIFVKCNGEFTEIAKFDFTYDAEEYDE